LRLNKCPPPLRAGFVLLGGVPQISSVNIAGIALNTLGGIWYAKIKYEERSGRAPHVQA